MFWHTEAVESLTPNFVFSSSERRTSGFLENVSQGDGLNALEVLLNVYFCFKARPLSPPAWYTIKVL